VKGKRLKGKEKELGSRCRGAKGARETIGVKVSRGQGSKGKIFIRNIFKSVKFFVVLLEILCQSSAVSYADKP
jgi:hypothetical protein